MTKKTKGTSKKKQSKVFQIIGVVLIIGLLLYLAFANLFNQNNNEKTAVKSYTTIDFVKNGELTFLTSDDKYISKIDIEIAEDDDARTQGLMYREKMKKNQGMLFIFPYESMQSFWMKNTVIPLDMIFVNKNNEIVTIRKNAVPFDTGHYASTKPAQFVIEVNAGYTDSLGIKVSDKIVWRRN
ncbi:hypothetical protein MNBD_IGNAVI01-2836 [hydrothermal vent metagenome]|uniref:DUF192 domain-containing protein n=1 Tax=hydrothermal vent metagenome TaxID=652676 RepID=A0A3B1C6W1_9ZZZZ